MEDGTNVSGQEQQAQKPEPKPEPKKEYEFVEPKFEYEEQTPSVDSLMKQHVSASQENAALKAQLAEMQATMQRVLGERLAGGQQVEDEDDMGEVDPQFRPVVEFVKTAKSGISELRGENKLLREKLDAIERGMAEQRTSGLREKVSDTVRRINEQFGGVDLVEEYQVVREMREMNTLDHEAVAKRLAKRKAEQLAKSGYVRKVERRQEPMQSPWGRGNAGEAMNEPEFTKPKSMADLDVLLEELGDHYSRNLNER